MGNGEAKELICMTHGHELRCVNDGGKRECKAEGNKEEKKMDNWNSIINKICFKNKRNIPRPATLFNRKLLIKIVQEIVLTKKS